MRVVSAIILCGFMLLAGAGCNDENVRKAEAAAAEAAQAVVILEGQIDQLQTALAQSNRQGDRETSAAIRAKLTEAKDLLPAMRQTAEATEKTMAAVRSANEARWGALEWTIATLATVVGGGGGGAAIIQAIRAGRYKEAASHALVLADALKDRAENANRNHGAEVIPLEDITNAQAFENSQRMRGIFEKLRQHKNGGRV